MKDPKYQLIQGNCLEVLKRIPDESIHCCVTSPPYLGLRDYGLSSTKWGDGWEGCLGLEPTPEMYVTHMVEICREVKRVIRKNGTFWLNIGDSYAGGDLGGGGYDDISDKQATNKGSHSVGKVKKWQHPNIKQKDLIGVPWMLAFALRNDGWYLRSDIIWCLNGNTHVYVRSQKGEMPMMIKDIYRLTSSTIKLWNGKKWTQMVNIVRSGKRKKQIELVLRSGERIRCTNTHRWPVVDKGVITAQEIEIGDIIESCNLPEPESPKNPKFIPDEIGWLLGLYLAEGSLDSSGTIQISGNISEKEYRLSKIEKITEEYGGSCCCFNLRGKAITINIYSKIILSIIKNYICGNNAKNKHLKVSCWQRSNKLLAYLLRGYLDGDGHNDKINNRYRIGFTRNYGLERDLRILCSRLGYQLTLKLSTSYIGDRAFPSFRGEIRFETGNHHNCKNRQEIMAIKKAKVATYYDIETEDNPHLFALSSGILTHNSKNNPMPSSVKDRCTSSHEYLFMFSKNKKYFYDYFAISEPMNKKSAERYKYSFGKKKNKELKKSDNLTAVVGYREYKPYRNKRDVWNINVKGFKGAHFAVMPLELAENCVLAGTSEMGCCPECGSPLKRIIDKKRIQTRPGKNCKVDNTKMANRDFGRHVAVYGESIWEKTCEHDFDNSVPCKVLDIFNGAGTVGYVALKNNQDYVGIELNKEYIDITRARLSKLDPLIIKEEDIFDIGE